MADGGIGPNTLAKLEEYLKFTPVEQAIKTYQESRQDYYEQLSTFSSFGRGWTRRVQETTKMALEMI